MTNLYNPAIYSASKIWHAKRWQTLRDAHGFNIVATWIDLPCGDPDNPTGAKLLTDAEKMVLWSNCVNEIIASDMTVIYTEETDSQRGVMVEMGGALALGKPVFLIGDSPDFRPRKDSDAAYAFHPLFHRVQSDNWFDGYHQAVDMYREKYRSTKNEIKPATPYSFGRFARCA